MNDILSHLNTLSLPWRLVAFAGLAVVTHLVVILLRQFGQRALSSQQLNRHQKLRSIATLTTSALVFTLYFLAIGLILREFGVSLTAYLASASVVGLAIGFGSQGIVQDVVTGLTFIFSDLVDVGDLVEISGQTGIVKAITMRFVELGNAMGATVFIPNRTINNVINYPRGYVRCIVDITLRGDDSNRDAIEASALRLMSSVQEQFPGIQMREPSSEGRIKFDAGKEILRIKFRIWPNREKPIETTYLQELIAEIKQIIPDYQPWMVSISYEVEKRVSRAAKKWLWQSGG
ncbi:MAG: mechanosensitive ion channel family protein [Gammaproteobacteria bacterium]|nr:mechanosensitive ion channel family protein [Gammaproteobacteria bacterium]